MMFSPSTPLLSAFLGLFLTAANSLCTSESSPNPIRSQYPNLTTGVINGTISIIPIPLSLARSIIPARYNILTHAYYSLLPSFPQGKYPLVVQPVLDHDIGQGAIGIPDFSRTVVSFPFVDVLGDNYTSIRTGTSALLSDNPVAIAGSIPYGPPLPVVGVFDPPCDGYRFVNGAKDGEIMFDGFLGVTKLPGQQPVVQTRFDPVSSQPYPLEFYKNVTNQPSTGNGNGIVCDNFISLFNSSASTGENEPVPIKGTVTLKKPLLPEDQSFTNVFGLKVALAFIENNYIPCTDLKGYSAA